MAKDDAGVQCGLFCSLRIKDSSDGRVRRRMFHTYFQSTSASGTDATMSSAAPPYQRNPAWHHVQTAQREPFADGTAESRILIGPPARIGFRRRMSLARTSKSPRAVGGDLTSARLAAWGKVVVVGGDAVQGVHFAMLGPPV